MKIILGSKSLGRKMVLEKAGYAFDVFVADIDEKAIRSENYEELPLLIAQEKTKALLPTISEPSLLITSDLVVICHGELREKPESKEQAREYLESYSQYPAQTFAAVVITNTATGKSAEGVDSAKTYFKSIPPDVIDAIIEQGDVMRAAGGFIVDSPLFAPYIDHIDGERESVIGLPLALTKRLMKEVSR